jgi:hypothetical protein
MRALRRVVDVRAVTAGAVIAVAALASAGCSQFDAALGKQELVVTFRAGTSQDAMTQARAACSNIPNSAPEPMPTAANVTSGAYDVRFRIDHASDADIARLQTCLSRFKSVQGVNVEQAGGN